MNAPRQSIIAGLVSGEVDYAGIGGAQTAFRSRARGLVVSIIGCTSSTTNYLLLGNNKVRTVAEAIYDNSFVDEIRRPDSCANCGSNPNLFIAPASQAHSPTSTRLPWRKQTGAAVKRLLLT